MERLDLYAAVAADLIARDLAYPCYCTSEELEEDRRRAEAEHRPPRYEGRCARLTPDGAGRARGGGPTRRAALPRPENEVIAFDDAVRGHVEINTDALGGDFVIVRGDGTPLYHFTVVVDDAAMEISHVIRGEDHLSNTPEAHPAVPCARAGAAGVRAPAADPQPRSHEDEQAQEPDGRVATTSRRASSARPS